jgi:hypothetical protein
MISHNLKTAVIAVLLIAVFATGIFAPLIINTLLTQSTSILNIGSGAADFSGSTFMWLHTNGTRIYDANDQEVVWNGINSKSLFGYWIYPPSEEFLSTNDISDISIIRSYGLNFIRVWISLSQAVYGVPYTAETPTNLVYYPAFWTTLDSIVNAAAKHGMWIDLDFHLSDGTWSNIGGFWGDGSGFPAWMYDGSWSYFNKVYTNDAAGRSDAIRDFWNTGDTTAANVRTAYQTFWRDIATRYANAPNVVFSLFNEPMAKWGGPELWTTNADWPTAIQMYQQFMQQTIDVIRNVDGGTHLIIINEAYAWDFSWNLQINRPNIVIENHGYWNDNSTNIYNDVLNYAQLAWRYNQPFELGEFGGIEQGLQTEASAIYTMQAANQLDVGWVYLYYYPPTMPSAQTWTDLQNNLRSNLIY